MLGKRILITGGMGNLGSWLVRYFVKENYEVYAVSRSEKNYNRNDGYSLVLADITKPETLTGLKSIDVDYCIHTASYNEYFEDGYPQKALEINALGTRNIAEALLGSKTMQKFIYVSTFHIYGTASGNIDESMPPNPKNDYALTHLFAEYYLKRFYETDGFNYYAIRLTNSYGAPVFKDTSKWYLVLNDMVKMAYHNQSIVLNGDGLDKRDFIWMGDVCSTLEKILRCDSMPGGNYNLSSEQSIDILSITNKVASSYEARYGRQVTVKTKISAREQETELCVSSSKLRNCINFELHDMFDFEINKIFDILESK